jgi:membrane carboxypeptidase/penicillin-binding protein
VALPIWVDFMRASLPKQEASIEEPDHIVRLRINRQTGLPVTTDLGDSMFEVFSQKNMPTVATAAVKTTVEEEQSSTLRDEIF